MGRWAVWRGAGLREEQGGRPEVAARFPFAVAVALVALAGGLRAALAWIPGAGAPYVTFYPAVVLAALYGGTRAGLLAGVLCALLANLLFSGSEAQALSVWSLGPLVEDVLFLAGCVLTCSVIGAMRRAQARARELETAAKVEEARRGDLEALQRSEARLRLFFDHSPVALAMFDRQMRYLHATRRWLEEHGLAARDPSGLCHYEVVADVADRWSEVHRRSLAGEVVGCDADRFERPDGTVRWVRWETRPWLDNAGEVGGIVVFTEDVTERKKAVDRLDLLARAASELLKSRSPQEVVDRLCQDVLAFLDCDVFFNFLADAESGRLRLNAFGGIPAEEARKIEWLDYGVAVCGCAALEGCRIVAEDIPGRRDPRTELVASYGVKAYAAQPLVSRGRVLGTLSFGTRRRLRFQDDELSLIQAVADHVSIALERKRAEETLHEQAQRLHSHVENSPLAVVEWDAGFTVTRWAGGAERLFGFSEAEAVGRRLGDLGIIPRDELPAAREAMSRLAQGESLQAMSTGCNLARDGSPIHCQWYNSALLDADGKLVSVLSLVLDVTERVRHERELLAAREAADAANRAKSDFLAMMSHEIRTPLSGVLGMTELALLETASPKVREYLAVSKSSAKHLLDIINDVLDLAKIESGRIELADGEFDLRREISAVVSNLDVLARQRGLHLECRIDPRTPSLVRGDRARVMQVLVNVLGNAVKFTEEGGVSLAVGPTGRGCGGRVELLFSVKDTGIGIPPDKLSAVFERFSQASVAHHARYGGTGLGLAIARELVELMDGRIWVESEPGVGSTFQFTVELESLSAGRRKGEPGAAEEASGPERPLAILFADDNPVNRTYGQALLERRGHQVVVATDGLEALTTLSKRAFDLVLLDVQMPGLDGLEVARAVRAGEVPGVRRDLPLVALTAHALKGDRERFLEAGMDDYLSKPIDLDELDRTLARWSRAPAPPAPPAGGVEPPPEARGAPDLARVQDQLANLVDRLPADSVRKLVDMSLDDLGPGLGRLRAALGRSDFDALAKEAHGLRGAWTILVGSERMLELTRELERCKEERAREPAEALVGELAREVARVRAFITEERQKLGV